jgi:hypothetical protein
VEHGLGKGSEFTIKKVAHQNGKKIGSKLELSLVSAAAPVASTEPQVDNLREVSLNCIHDADYVAKNSGLQFSLDTIQKLATTIFIQRTRTY